MRSRSDTWAGRGWRERRARRFPAASVPRWRPVATEKLHLGSKVLDQIPFVLIAINLSLVGRKRSLTPNRSNGYNGGQARRTSVHQRRSSPRECSHSGLLQDVSFCLVRSNSRNSWSDWFTWLYLLLLGFCPSLHAFGIESWTAVE